MAEMAGDRARKAARDRARHARAEVDFWRNLYLLAPYARPHLLPPLNRYRSARRRRLLVPRIPLQRTAPPGLPSAPRQRRTH